MLQTKPKTWQAREDWHQLNLSCPWWSLLNRDTLHPSPLVEPSRSTPTATQLLPLSWGCLQNQALANPEFPNGDADLVESAWLLGSGAKSRALHISYNSGSKNERVSRMRMLAQWQGSGLALPTPQLLLFIGVLGANCSAPLPSVSSPLVTVVSNMCSTARDKLCSMRFTRPKTPSSLVNNQANTHQVKIGRYDDKSNCSLMAAIFEHFLQRRWTGTMSRVDVLLHYWGSQHDRY